MTQAYWAIRLYVPFDDLTTINFVGSFDHLGKRYLDHLVVFNGMYGIPGFLLWYIHKDLVTYNFSTYGLELKLFLTGDMNNAYFTERYRVVDVRDDFNEDKKVVIALRESDMKLNSLLIDADIGTLEFNETRTVEQLLYDVLEKTGIIPVVFDEHDDHDKKSFQFEYKSFTLDPTWTVRDFIIYIANENNFEWAIKDDILFIGPELHTYKELKSTRDWINRSVDNISKNYFNMKIGFSPTPLDILYNYELEQDDRVIDMRCIWVKHCVGKDDLTKGCFVSVGRRIDKETYFYSLEEKQEISLALRYLFKNVEYNPIIVGGILEDSGENEYIENVSIQKDIYQYSKKIPRDIILNKNNSIYTLPRIGRTTPYMDNEAGLFFPSIQDPTNCPNSLIFCPYDRIEQAVMGPFVYGNGKTIFGIPYKNPSDFRLTLPKYQGKPGPTLYIQSDGKLLYQPLEFPLDNLSVANKPFITFDNDGNFHVYKDDENHIWMYNAGEYKMMSLHSTDQFLIMSENEIIIVNVNNSSRIELQETGDILIKKGDNSIITLSDSEVEVSFGSNKVTIDTSKVEMVAGASKATLTTAGLDVT